MESTTNKPNLRTPLNGCQVYIWIIPIALATKSPLLAFGTHAYTARKICPLSQTLSKAAYDHALYIFTNYSSKTIDPVCFWLA